MENPLTLFITTLTTMLAVINPLESLPIYLQLLAGQDEQAHRRVARLACLYATLLIFFFLVFGTVMLHIFSVPLSMVRIVGGIILMRIGFSLFLPSPSGGVFQAGRSGSTGEELDIAFVPLAMPIMFGPGALATVLGMCSLVRHPISDFISLVAISLACLAAVLIIYLILTYARYLMDRLGAKGIDAATRIVGFFVAAMGMGLVFHGIIEALQTYHIIPGN
ncbi:MAG: MarC family protein [Desulfobacterales bacterium]|nr:MarC family protein [Pseudomonadota bacterium]MCG2773099.1 MarC family protein [Desulfobacterales bacterium]